MTELEKIQRAKMYIDKLANGVDPITDTELPNDNTLNNVRLSRCFFYVSDILRQVIENDGNVTAKKADKPAKKPSFFLSLEKRGAFPFSQKDLRVTEIAARLNTLADEEGAGKLSPVMISNWLFKRGFLERIIMPNGKRARTPTKQGEYTGLSSQICQSPEGEYYAVMYNEDAQHFVLDNLDAILSREKKSI